MADLARLPRKPDKGAVIAFPKMTKAQQRALLSGEMGTAFDLYTRLFTAWSEGDVFDVGDWRARDMDEMLKRDGDAVMIEQALTLLPKSTTYGLEAAAKDRGEHDLIMAQLFQPKYAGGYDPGMTTVIGQMAEAAVYRKAFFEKEYDLVDGKVVLKKLAWRPPTTCDLRRNSQTAAMDGFLQRAWWFSPGAAGSPLRTKGQLSSAKAASVGGSKFTGWIPIPKQRAFVYIHGLHRAPLTGASDMDITYWAFKQKQKISFLWFQFIETQAHPKLVAYGTTQDDANEIASSLAAMKSSAVAGFERPPGGARLFDVIQSSGNGSGEFTSALAYLSSFQAKSVLASFLELGGAAQMSQGSGSFGIRGSYALAESQSKFFLRARQGQVNEMTDAFTTDVIAPLCILNFGPDAAIPKLTAAPLTEADGSLIVNTLNALAVAQDLRVPDAYVDLIAAKAGDVLDLSAEKVNQALRQQSSMAMQQAAQLSATAASPIGQGAAKIAASTKTASRAIAAAQAGVFDEVLELSKPKGYTFGWRQPSNSESETSSSSE